MRKKSTDVYLEGANNKAIAVLVVVAVVICAVIGVAIIVNIVSPSTDPHNVEVINFSHPTVSPTVSPSTNNTGSATNITVSTPVNSTHDSLKIHFLDVGQADCALIEHDGKYAFVDVGKSTKGTYYSTIRLHEPEELEWILASHQDSDHIGNIAYVMSACTVNEFYDNGVSTNTLTYQELMDKISSKGIEYTILREGDSIDTWDDVKITAIAVNSSNGKDLNDDSIVLRLEYDGVIVGFTGDISDDVDAEVGEKLGDVDILKVAHHGAETSTSDEFLESVKPELSIISVGDNSYGHPSEDTIKRLNEYGTVYRTDQQGCVEVVISDGNYKVVGCEYV